MKKYRAVISDLDGTLLNEDSQITPYTREVIKKLEEKGIPFFIATGRCFQTADKIREKLDIKCHVISSNGAEIYDQEGNLVYINPISKEKIRELIQFKVEEQFERFIVDGGVFYKEHGNPYDEGSVTYKSADFSSFQPKNPINFYYRLESRKNLEILEKKVKEKFGETLSICISTNERLDIMNSGVSKAEGVQKVLENMGINIEESVAFGDQMNDYEMLSKAGNGYIMENSCSELKNKFPRNKMIGNNNSDSVAKKIAEIFSIDI